MSLLGKLLKTTIDVVTIPIDIVKDTVTMGGILTDEDHPYIINKVEKICDDVDEISDEVDNL